MPIPKNYNTFGRNSLFLLFFAIFTSFSPIRSRSFSSTILRLLLWHDLVLADLLEVFDGSSGQKGYPRNTVTKKFEFYYVYVYTTISRCTYTV